MADKDKDKGGKKGLFGFRRKSSVSKDTKDKNDGGDKEAQPQAQQPSPDGKGKGKGKEQTPAAGPGKEPVGDGGVKLYRHLEAMARMGATGGTEGSTAAAGAADGTTKGSSPHKQIEQAKAGQAAKVRQKRLMKELRDLQKSAAMQNGVFTAELVNDNLFEWDVKLKMFDPDSKLAQDLMHMKRVHGIDDVWLRISFPENYPFDPPFLRVLAPLVQGGYVLTGGAICMELLTPQGWSQAYTIEAVIMQTMSTMIKGDARIVAQVKKEFSEAEARRAYEYLVKTHAKHGWNTPPKAEG